MLNYQRVHVGFVTSTDPSYCNLLAVLALLALLNKWWCWMLQGKKNFLEHKKQTAIFLLYTCGFVTVLSMIAMSDSLHQFTRCPLA
jgi:hypothetical protein